MADGFDMKLDTKELDEWLSKLPSKFAGRVAKQALAAAGEPILAAAKVLCPVRTDTPTPGSNALEPGVLRESLTLQVQTRKGYAPRVKVGAPSETAHVMWWIENGYDHFTGGRKGYGGSKGEHIAGRHVLAGAFDESAQRAVDVMLETLSEALNDTGEAVETEE